MPSQSETICEPAAAGGPSVVLLGTGGTIAGTAANADDAVGYSAAQLGIGHLLSGLPGVDVQSIEAHQLAQIDSKDMDVGTWRRLALAIDGHLQRPEVGGVVVTHGTDTLEETGWLLQALLAPAKPLVLTAAMRPATALGADGPRNLIDALTLARQPGVQGVLAMLDGRVHAAAELRKQHTLRVDAFSSGDAGPLALIEEGRLRRFREWPAAAGDGLRLDPAALPADPADWPWVEVLASHADARPAALWALLAAGVRGIVLAGTGNGTVHAALEPAIDEARAAGVPVWLCSRCANGAVVGASAGPAANLTPWQARVALQLHLLGHPGAPA